MYLIEVVEVHEMSFAAIAIIGRVRLSLVVLKLLFGLEDAIAVVTG